MLSAFNAFNSFYQAFNTNVKSSKSISTDIKDIEKNLAFNKYEKMHVLENEDVLLKNNSMSQNIEGAFSEENVKSIVNQDKKVSTDDDSSFQQGMLKAVKSMLIPLKAVSRYRIIYSEWLLILIILFCVYLIRLIFVTINSQVFS
jgi:hypothetical protein